MRGSEWALDSAIAGFVDGVRARGEMLRRSEVGGAIEEEHFRGRSEPPQLPQSAHAGRDVMPGFLAPARNTTLHHITNLLPLVCNTLPSATRKQRHHLAPIRHSVPTHLTDCTLSEPPDCCQPLHRWFCSFKSRFRVSLIKHALHGRRRVQEPT